MAYTIITPMQVTIAGRSIDLQSVNSALIGQGTDSIGTGASEFLDNTGYKFRHLANTMLLLQNTHPFLNAYARIVTTLLVQTLSVEDSIHVIPPGSSLYVVSKFTDIFYAQDTIDGIDYSDFIEVNFAHDATEVADMIKYGVLYE